ncbi:MAG: hypothetical protein JWO67_10 [Streptosporangiaceae bacterium]|nr:hypothetical protein [Streptosporangiaceae bacterium]
MSTPQGEPGRWAVVEGGTVTNVIVLHDPADVEWAAGQTPVQLAGQPVSIGDGYDGQTFTPAPAPKPAPAPDVLAAYLDNPAPTVADNAAALRELIAKVTGA